MPLDQIARRYADEMFTGRLEHIIREQQQKKAAVRQDYTARNMLTSGLYVSAEGKIQGETIGLLTRARAETLLAAYERAGLPLDDVAVAEITAEIKEFCQIKQRQAVENLTQIAAQALGTFTSSGAAQSVAGQVENAVNSVVADISRELRIKRYEIVLDERKNTKVYAAALGKQWDVFISHASEDKEGFVRPLAAALAESGLTVWFDETTLRVGVSLRRAIDEGLAKSKYGVVVLSHAFFSKEWPQQELDGLFSREIEGVSVILPVWHNITKDEVGRYSPLLAGRLAANSRSGIEFVVRQLREAMGL
jgi:hypothetical protein